MAKNDKNAILNLNLIFTFKFSINFSADEMLLINYIKRILISIRRKAHSLIFIGKNLTDRPTNKVSNGVDTFWPEEF